MNGSHSPGQVAELLPFAARFEAWIREKEAAGKIYPARTSPIHNRQVVVLPREDWQAWLFQERPEAELLRPLPSSCLAVEQVR